MPARTARNEKNSVVLKDALVSVSRRGAGRWALWRPSPSAVRERVAPGVVLMDSSDAMGIRNRRWSVLTAIAKSVPNARSAHHPGWRKHGRSDGGPRPDEAAGVELLGELDGVRGGALAQVVRHDPHLQPALVRRVAAQAADEDHVAPGGAGRGRVWIDERDARHPLEQRPGLVHLERLAGLEVDGLRVRVGDGHARARDGDR